MTSVRIIFAVLLFPIASFAGVCDSGHFQISTGGRESSFTGTLSFQKVGAQRRHQGHLTAEIAFDVYGNRTETLHQVRCDEQSDGYAVLTFWRTWSTGSQFYKLYIQQDTLEGSFNYYGDGRSDYTHHDVVGSAD